MRIALFSDIHGNSYALEAVLSKIADLGVDQIYCLGDVFLCHAGVVRVAELLEENQVIVIRGNHDMPLDHIDRIRPEHHDWLLAQETWYDFHNLNGIRYKYADTPIIKELRLEDGQVMKLFHSHPENLWARINSASVPEKTLKEVFGDIPGDILAYGHYHQPHILNVFGKTLLNVASVDSLTSIPRDALTRFTIVDSHAKGTRIQQYSLPYDAEKQQKMDRQYRVPNL